MRTCTNSPENLGDTRAGRHQGGARVVTGHIVAVIAAHDRALSLLPAGHQLTGRLTMMLVMVGHTFTGLYLLFGG